MTDRMHDDTLDREIRTFLSWQAQDLAEAPTAAEMAFRVGSRTGGLHVWPRVPSQVRWAVVAMLLLAALATAASLVGMFPPWNDPGPRAYEAIFLRLEAVGSSIDVIVVGVNAEGHERVIAHLPTRDASGYGANGPNALLGWTAGVSPSGLLALPRTTGAYAFRWQIIDLLRPGAAPIDVPGFEQDFDVRTYGFGNPSLRRPLAFWGPDDRVAITMYKRAGGTGKYYVSLLNGRTGVGTSQPPPDGRYLPWWAGDGSGIHVELADQPGAEWVLRPDGSLTTGSFGFASDGHDRRYRADGTPSGTFEDLDIGGYVENEEVLLLARTGIMLGDVAWTADGNGRWLLLPTSNEADGLRLDRVVAGRTTTVATLDDPLAGSGRVVTGWFAGLAPDDSMVIVDRDRIVNITSDSFERDSFPMEVIVPGTLSRFSVDGYFAGWLEVPE